MDFVFLCQKVNVQPFLRFCFCELMVRNAYVIMMKKKRDLTVRSWNGLAILSVHFG